MAKKDAPKMYRNQTASFMHEIPGVSVSGSLIGGKINMGRVENPKAISLEITLPLRKTRKALDSAYKLAKKAIKELREEYVVPTASTKPLIGNNN